MKNKPEELSLKEITIDMAGLPLDEEEIKQIAMFFDALIESDLSKGHDD